MKIAIDASVLQIETHGLRGIGNYVRNLIFGLISSDKDNHYCFLVNPGQKIDINSQAQNFRIRERRLSQLPILKKFFLQKNLYLLLDALSCHADVTHFTTHVNAPAYQPFKSVVTVHDTIPYVFPERYLGNRGLKNRLYENFTIRSAKNANIVIAVSESTKKDVVNYFDVDPGKIRVIYEGVSDLYKPLDKERTLYELRNKYRIDRSFILYVGAFDFRKNVLGLIDIFFRLKAEYGVPHKLVIAGQIHCDAEFITILKKIISLRLWDEVIFEDYIPGEDLPLFYSGADAFVFPSLYEGFGLPLLEAMACGTPVVAYNVSSIPEVVGDTGLLVQLKDTDKFASEVYRILSDEDLKKELSKKGVNRAREFTWERTVEQTLKVYNEFC